MKQKQNEREAGIFSRDRSFFVGCNYWASHAGTNMWSDWSAEIVESDFKALSDNGVQVLRVFPLWPDFQPIVWHTGCNGVRKELRLNEKPLPDDPVGAAGVETVMIERFRIMAKLAHQYRLQLIVGLVTGWMSGRLHVPPAFYGVNVITDPEAVIWQVRMVRCLVRELRDLPAIVAWDLGNECNCMGSATREQAWNWSNAVASAIRLEDAGRPVVSGMHSLVLSPNHRTWTIQDQSELTDVLTTHPYPLFTPYCNQDPSHTMRGVFHAVAETRLYGDVGNVAAFVEEAGTLGPGTISDRLSAVYLNNILWNSWAHDCRGLLWWCGHDQTELKHTPYDWMAVERELGLLKVDLTPKPALVAMQKFAAMLDRENLRTLPSFRRDAVCILSKEQDNWAVAYSSFILAKQAGFDIEFQYCDQPLKPAKLYLLPSIRGYNVINRFRYDELLKQVSEGATLLITRDDGHLQPFNEVAGCAIEYVCRTNASVTVATDEFKFSCNCEFKNKFSLTSAEALGVDSDGDPVFFQNRYGKGKVLVLGVPIELAAAKTPGVFYPEGEDFYRVYQLAAEAAAIERVVRKTSRVVSLTEHFVSDHETLVIAVNNTPSEIQEAFTLAPGWSWRPGSRAEMKIPANSGVILRVAKQPAGSIPNEVTK